MKKVCSLYGTSMADVRKCWEIIGRFSYSSLRINIIAQSIQFETVELLRGCETWAGFGDK